jgi:hypothetical protein
MRHLALGRTVMVACTGVGHRGTPVPPLASPVSQALTSTPPPSLTAVPTATPLLTFTLLPVPIERQFTPPPEEFVSLMGLLTAFVSNTTVALVEDCELPRSKQPVWGIPG